MNLNEIISYIEKNKLINNDNGSFNPQKKVTIGQFLNEYILFIGLYPTNYRGELINVSISDNYAGAIQTAFDEKLLDISDSLFNPKEDINALILIDIIFRSNGLFLDKNALQSKIKDDLQLNSIIKDINSSLTGIEMATIIYYLLNSLKEEIFKKPSNLYKLFKMNHDLSKSNGKELDNLIKNNILATNFGGTVVNVPWEKNWTQSHENLDALKNIAITSKKAGLELWLYDEYWYPSGWANGLAIKENPENAAKNITVLKIEGIGRELVHLSLPQKGISFIYIAFYNIQDDGDVDYTNPYEVATSSEIVSCSGLDGKWQCLAFYICKHNVCHMEEKDPEKLPGGYREFLNFLNKSAVNKFINTALQPIKSNMDNFGSVFNAIFTDEPAMMNMYLRNKHKKVSINSVPWGDTLFEKFKEEYGYDLKPYLVYLFIGDCEKAKTVRVQYYRLLANLLRANFTDNIANWCHKSNIRYSGHFLLEEATYFHVGYYADFMKVIEGFDYPGFDTLTASKEKYWEKYSAWGSSWYMGAKYASSVSRIKGHNITMNEICPVQYKDDLVEDPFDGFMGLTTSITFTGATHINVYGSHLIEDLTLFEEWNNYIGRINYILRNSRSDNRIGVYYPIADAQSELAVKDLNMEELTPQSNLIDRFLNDLIYDIYIHKFDCNFLTEDAILSSEISGNILSVKQTKYNCIIMPRINVLPLAVMKKLNSFISNGGKVYFLDNMPKMGVNEAENTDIINLSNKLMENLVCYSTQKDVLFKKISMDINYNIEIQSSESILVSRYIHKGNTMYYLMNKGNNDENIHINVLNDESIVLLNPLDGSIQKLQSPFSINMKSSRGLFVEILKNTK